MQTIQIIETVTTTMPTTTTKMNTIKPSTLSTSTNHPRERLNPSNEDKNGGKSMKTIEHHSANIYDSDRDIIRKHSE